MESFSMSVLISVLLFVFSYSAFGQVKFSNESEISSIQTGGNSKVETYNLKTLSKWNQAKRTYSFGGHYTLSASEQVDDNDDEEKVTSVRNWDVNARYEQELSKVLTVYTAIIYEGDEFSGIDQRENLDLGAKHYFTKKDKTTSFAEVGLRYSLEKRTTRDENDEDKFDFTKGRVYYEIDHKYSESVSYKFWLEYIPNFTDSEDYLVSYEPSVAVVLTNMFSLKVAYKSLYDNVPNVEGNENTDYTFTTSLIAKF